MRGKQSLAILFLLVAAALFSTCASPADSRDEKPRARPAGGYYSGDGGKGLSIAVLAPEAGNLDTTEAYIPALVQGVLVSNLSKFSAMQVMDRQNLEKVIAEGESGVYANESDFVQLGTAANVQYILNGAIQKTGAGFLLQLKVSEASTGMSKASHNHTYQMAELDDFSAINKAADDLFPQLGVNLTDAGRDILLAAATPSYAAAETALARGVTAQQSGSTVAALVNFYEAARFDPSLLEAASRSSVLSKNITSGNLGQNVRNEIQRYDAWKKVVDDAIDFFNGHPYLDVVYNTTPQQGNINFNRRTVDVNFNAWFSPNTGFDALKNILGGLRKADRDQSWNIDISPLLLSVSPSGGQRNYYLEVEAELLNDAGQTIGKLKKRLEAWWESGNWGNLGSLRRIHAGSFELSFNDIAADAISENMTIKFTTISKLNHVYAGEFKRVNSTVDTHVIPTDKSYSAYMRGKQTAFDVYTR
jgi:TolB-like protein